MVNPLEDGITHINVYSKGRTELGRFLSNFADVPSETEDGWFRTIEGYWYWLGCHDDRLRTTNGWESKTLGRSLRAPDWIPDSWFKNKICSAIKQKLLSHQSYLNELKRCKLPLTHYYQYGNRVIQVPQADWILDFIDSLRK